MTICVSKFEILLRAKHSNLGWNVNNNLCKDVETAVQTCQQTNLKLNAKSRQTVCNC